ncbi:hypothetical protein D3C85_1480640 [compost metagenome]
MALVLKPSLRSTSMPGMYWPVRVIRNSGNATLSKALSENTGMLKTGAANCSCNPDKSTRSWVSRKASPNTRMPTTA